jgi:Zn-finger nucleic acid-binding protein
MDLTCPKCQSPMRNYERNGVTIDQCSECRGIFLDRGELERLIDQESSYYEGRQPEPRREERYEERHERERHGHHGHGYGYGKKRKREGFLSDLFD